MSSRKDLETRIAQRLKTLTPEDMQRLAEDYARLRFPDRFPRFDFRALSPEGKSRAGWPDAYIVLNGRVDGVEATIDKNSSKIWKHLAKDVVKARKLRPKLSGFIFVSGHPEIQPDDDELNRWRQRFAEKAGLELRRVDLVFGGRLVQELARPEFARTRVEVLGLTDLPAWFELVRLDVPPDSPRAEFIPTPDDYARARVHRPLDADRVLGHLEREGRALVRGVGASGKTVLAWLLALDTAREGLPAYYLDLARLGDRAVEAGNGLEDDMIRFGHPRALFILDNIHLDERLAKRLAVAWEELVISQRPRLLLVGRELHTGRGSPIAGLDIATLPLKARQAEVAGVYRRLVWGKTGLAAMAEPPAEVLDRWVMTFGGDPTSADTTTDLIAFSAAVLKRLPELLNQMWALTGNDAVDEIREAYLKRLSEGETRNLMRLSVLAEWDLSLSEAALADQRAGFDIASRQLGLVFLEHAGARGQYVRYRLAHAALGRLLLAAAYEPTDLANEQRVIALADPSVGFALAYALAAAGQQDRARAILSMLMEDPTRLLELPNLNSSLSALRLVQHHNAAPLSEIGRVWGDSNNRLRLAERALLTPLDQLQSFLAYTENTKELNTVFNILTAELAKHQNLGRLARRTLLAYLGDLQSFLAYAEKRKQLETVFATLTAELGRDQHRDRLVERALLTSLGDLQTFFVYAQQTKELKTVFATLTAELGKEPNRGLLRERFTSSPLDQLTRVLAADTAKDFWSAILVDIDEEEWERNRLQVKGSMEAFVSFQKLATATGRPELAAAPALMFVRSADLKQWHRRVIGLHHLSHVLRCATKRTEEETRRFLQRIATAEWIDYQVQSGARTGGLAGSLLALSTTLSPDFRKPFLRSSLRDRIIKELSATPSGALVAWSQTLSLLGAAAALGFRLESAEAQWPLNEDLATILELRMPGAERTTLGALEVQLWRGLREMGRLRVDTVSIPAKQGDAILTLWRAAHDRAAGQSPPLHIREANAGMIAWLERCEANGWRLIDDDG